MTQLFANVSLANTFNVWRLITNQLVEHINKSANTTGVSNIRSANLVITNLTTLSGPVTVSGNTTWSAPTKTISGSNTVISSNVTFTSTGAVKLPAGTTAQRGLHSSKGHIRFNTSLGAFEGYTGTTWRSFIANATVTSTYVTNTVFQSALANTNTRITTLDNTRKSNLANTNAYIAKKYAVSNVEAKFVSNTYAQATFSTVLTALDKTSITEQTIQPSVIIANTFVSQKGAPIKTIDANTYTMILTDNGKYIRMANTGGVTITIPTNSSVAYPIGAEFIFIHTGGNTTMTFANAAGVTLNSRSGIKIIYHQFESATLKKVNTNEFDLAGV